MVRTERDIVAAGLSIAAGGFVGILIQLLATHRDLMDDAMFWLVGYPVALGASAVLGLNFPNGVWRWPVILFMILAVWVLGADTLKSGVPNLFPLTLLLFGVLSLPGIGAAYIGSWLAQLHR